MKFSIVTPSRNGDRYIREAIESVWSQEGDFEIEHIIMDGNSTDGTLDIIEGLRKRLDDGSYPIRCKRVSLKVVSGKDKSMYDAIDKGFRIATGDIYAWINTDDLYIPKAFDTMSKVFRAFPEIDWAIGRSDTTGEDSAIKTQKPAYMFRQDWIARGIYGWNAYFIPQDAVFWKRALWEKIAIRTDHRQSADYELWIQMARHAPLWTVNAPISCFRKHAGSMSTTDRDEYRETQSILFPMARFANMTIRLFFSLYSRFQGLFPFSEKIFLRAYPLLFPRFFPDHYIEFVNGKPQKKPIKTFAIHDLP